MNCKNYYEKEASKYDNKRSKCRCQKLSDDIIKEIVYGILEDKENILDCGCGTGRFGIYFSKKGHHVIGLDSSKNMLKICKSKSKGKMKLLLGDIENMEIKDNSIDGIVSINVLTHFKNKDKILKEFFRVSKDNGLIVFNRVSKPHQILSKIRELLGWSFDNYPETLEEIKKNLKENNIIFIEKIDFGLIPRRLNHILLCVLGLTILETHIKKIQKYNLGFHSLIIGRVKK